jgi:homoserine dehydrogenase
MKILLLGLGKVNKEVFNFLKELGNVDIYIYKKYPRQNYRNIKFVKNYKDVLNPDLVIEALPGKDDKDAEYAYKILREYLDRGIDTISCNKYMVQRYGHLLCYSANKNKCKFMLSSLMSNEEVVDNTNFSNYKDNELYKDRGVDHKQTAQSIIKDINIKIRRNNENN